jgi:large subunit ribosomal protein L28
MITGKKPQFGHNVSHSNRKTKKKFKANIRKKRLWLESENRFISIYVSSAGLRVIDKLGLEKALELSKNGG